MNILAIDTSSDYLSIAVAENYKILSRFHRKAAMAHSRLLVPTIDKVLKKAKIRLEDVGLFCISIGPGSFTGLRIGVTTIKGLSYALKKPISPVPTLDVIARNVKGFEGVICPVLDARKSKVYACLYKSDGKTIKRISEYLLLSVKDLMEKTAKYDKVLFLGDAMHLLGKPSVKKPDWHPRADTVARLGLEEFNKGRIVKAEDLEPMYLYSKECDITGN